jgi:hypothetical protein
MSRACNPSAGAPSRYERAATAGNDLLRLCRQLAMDAGNCEIAAGLVMTAVKVHHARPRVV